MSTREDSPPSTRPKRRHRGAAEAKNAILAAAEECLIRDGPDGLRLQTIANDLGISHSAILHHFGSRDALLQALSAHALASMNEDIVVQLSGPAPEGEEPPDVFERIFATLGRRGHAKLLAWRLLSGLEGEAPPEGGTLSEISRVLHERRVESAEQQALDPPSEEDTRFSVLLLAVALFGDALAGEQMSANVGLGTDDASRQAFRRWLADRIVSMLFPTSPTG